MIKSVTQVCMVLCCLLLVIPLAPCSRETKQTPVNQPYDGSPSMESPTAPAPKQEPPAQNTPPIQSPPSTEPETPPNEDEVVRQVQVTIGERTFTATPSENTAAQAFVDLMKTAPIVINMSDYSGFEKVGSLETDLPTSNNNITTQLGDIVLYNRNQVVIFYGTNTWSYTRLGKIDDLSGFQEALGSGDVTVSFSIQ